MKTTKTVIKNGIKVIVTEVPGVDLVSTNVTVGAGGRYETPKLFGISHFVEHMAFKGTKKYPTHRDLAEAIESIGGVKNAMTSDDYTTYWNKVPASHLNVALDVLNEQVNHSFFRQEDIEKERGVIIEEINRTNEEPMSFTLLELNRFLWEGQNAASDILGTKENIRRFMARDFKDYVQKYYTSENITISIAGGVNADEALKKVEKTFGLVEKRPKELPESIDMFQEDPRVRVINKDYKQAHVALAYKTFGIDDPRKMPFNVLITMIGEGMGSLLFEEIREKRGLAYAVVAAREYFSDAGYGIIYAGLNGQKAEEAVSVILDVLEQVKKGEFGDWEFSRAKEYLKGMTAGQMDGTEKISLYNGIHELLNPNGPSIKEAILEIEKVTKEEIISVAKEIFVPQKENLLVVGPFKDENNFAKILNSRR